MADPAICFIASDTPEADEAFQVLTARYGQTEALNASHVVALGGDGLMLRVLHRFSAGNVPIYGMNRGSVGFLMNDYSEDDLPGRLHAAEHTIIHPLEMTATTSTGHITRALAFNEVSLLRQTWQAAKLRLCVDGKERLDELICDGILVATPAGSTAYNLSAQGPILPINSPLLALTPISPFRPRRWRGAILSRDARVGIETQEADKRPVSAVADHLEVRDVVHVLIAENRDHSGILMFDQGHNLAERVLAEQFRY